MHYQFSMNQARGVVTQDHNGDRKIMRVEPGAREAAATLYPLWSTSINDLGDFGLGIGLYFRTLQAVALLLIICFLINIPVMIYYATNYDQYKYGEIVGMSSISSVFPIAEAVIGTAWCPYAPPIDGVSFKEDDWDVVSYLISCLPYMFLLLLLLTLLIN